MTRKRIALLATEADFDTAYGLQASLVCAGFEARLDGSRLDQAAAIILLCSRDTREDFALSVALKSRGDTSLYHRPRR